MVLRPQAKKSNRYNQKAFSENIKQFFDRHLSFFEKKSLIPGVGLWAFTSSGTSCSSKQFSMLKLLAKDRNSLTK